MESTLLSSVSWLRSGYERSERQLKASEDHPPHIIGERLKSLNAKPRPEQRGTLDFQVLWEFLFFYF